MAHNLIRLWPTTASDCGPHHQTATHSSIRLWPIPLAYHQTVAHNSIRLWPIPLAYHQTVAHNSVRLWPTSSDCNPQQHQTVARIISVPAVVQVNISLTWSQITSLKTGGQKDETYFGVFTLNTGQLCCLVQATTRKKKMKEFWLNQ